jgi:NDP-sugar pyrophosphorylase family protein
MCGAKQAGIEQFVIVVGYQGNQVRRWFAKSPLRRTSVIWVENPDFHKEQDAVDTGMFLCTPAVFDALEAVIRDGNCSLSDGTQYMASNRKLRAYDIQDAVWQDIDTPQMLDFTQVQMSPPRTSPTTMRVGFSRIDARKQSSIDCVLLPFRSE